MTDDETKLFEQYKKRLDTQMTLATIPWGRVNHVFHVFPAGSVRSLCSVSSVDCWLKQTPRHLCKACARIMKKVVSHE